ncbi:MAG: SDR family NAD(P)-dependent oxidoreductase [Pseudomonadota bacterium]
MLVIGASGGIGKAVFSEICNTKQPGDCLYVASRKYLSLDNDGVISKQLDYSERSIKSLVSQIEDDNVKLTEVYICTGVLHDFEQQLSKLKPEKRLEDINVEAFERYFNINTIIPSLWLKYLVNVMSKNASSIGIISARVGSISDNRLGGWYGYRSSKAALNMMIKTAAVEYARRAPKTCLVSYHPGTVDTELSKPFQANVKPEKLFTTEFTAERFVYLCRDSNPEDSPRYIDYDGNTIPW